MTEEQLQSIERNLNSHLVSRTAVLDLIAEIRSLRAPAPKSDGAWQDVSATVQRFSVPGGWLYRTSSPVYGEGGSRYTHWSDPVFVAEPPHPWKR